MSFGPKRRRCDECGQMHTVVCESRTRPYEDMLQAQRDMLLADLTATEEKVKELLTLCALLKTQRDAWVSITEKMVDAYNGIANFHKLRSGRFSLTPEEEGLQAHLFHARNMTYGQPNKPDEEERCFNGNHDSKDGRCIVDGGRK